MESKEKDKLTGIKVLSAIKPSSGSGTEHPLVSPNIDKYVEEYTPYEHELWNDFLSAEDGSVEEESVGRMLAKIYLLKTSQKLSSPDESLWGREREQWAERYTQSSAELYPAPHIEFVRDIIEGQLMRFDNAQGASGAYVHAIYERLHQATRELEFQDEPSSEMQKTLSEAQQEQLASAFFEMNPDWMEYMDHQQKESYTPAELTELFNELIQRRAKTDQRWRGWVAELDEDKNQVSVLGSKQKVSVGAMRTAADRSEAIGLVAHELGVHAQRAVSGGDIDDAMGEGLPGYLEIEESLGILSEFFVTGEMPEKAQDRYIDIALAMGVIPGVKMSRSELIELAYHRNIARKEVDADSAGPIDHEQHADALKKAKVHVDRIFRGGDGAESGAPAVFTKDAVYYPAELEGWLAEQLDAGKAPKQLLEFLLSGKFDPTNESHLVYLSERGIEL